jgi:hypothetical protein
VDDASAAIEIAPAVFDNRVRGLAADPGGAVFYQSIFRI